MNRPKKSFESKIFAAIFFAMLTLALILAKPAEAAPAKHAAVTPSQPQQTTAADSDKTLAAMQHELDRSRQRLELKIPDKSEPARPY